MPVRKDIPYKEGLFFITFTCHKWISLIEETNSYDLVYNWFDYLKKKNHRIAGYVIMPNHVHALIDFSAASKKINTVIGDGKRFIAYEIIERLNSAGKTDMLAQLEKAVTAKDKEKGKVHEVWEESFDWKYCETAKFAYQKLVYSFPDESPPARRMSFKKNCGWTRRLQSTTAHSNFINFRLISGAVQCHQLIYILLMSSTSPSGRFLIFTLRVGGDSSGKYHIL